MIQLDTLLRSQRGKEPVCAEDDEMLGVVAEPWMEVTHSQLCFFPNATFGELSRAVLEAPIANVLRQQ